MPTKKQLAEWNDAKWNKRVEYGVGRKVRDVVTGRAAVAGAKAVGRWLTQNVSRQEKWHEQITNSNRNSNTNKR